MSMFNKIRNLGTKTKIALTAVMLTAAVALPFAVQAEFYPDRPVFDYNKGSDTSNCADPNDPGSQNGRCGSMTGPVFNSFINTPSYGDERAFFDGRRSDQSVGSNADDITNVTEGSKQVVLRTYVHNNANQTTNSTVGVAHNANVRIALPTAQEQVLRARSYISANNAALVEDTADLIGNRKFSVSYVAGSAKLLRGTASYPLSDNIVTTGAQIGDTAMNGELPGCFDYAALVEITINITPEQVPNMQLTKQVRKHVDGQTGNWASEVQAKPGDTVDWLINTKNVGEGPLTNVVTRDVLPPHVQLIPSSITFTNAANGTVGLNDAPLFGGGYNSGRYNPNDNSLIVLTTRVLGDFEACQTRVRNVAYTHSTEYPTEISDDADVVITKDNCNPPVSYKCDLLKAEKTGTGRTMKYTVNASAAGGATIQRYIYNFGDGSPELTTDQSTTTHTYTKDGQFATRVRVQFAVNNQTVFAEGDQCAALVNFSGATTTSKPLTPGKLPETGAGDVFGAFFAATAAGMIGYYIVGRRVLGL